MEITKSFSREELLRIYMCMSYISELRLTAPMLSITGEFMDLMESIEKTLSFNKEEVICTKKEQ